MPISKKEVLFYILAGLPGVVAGVFCLWDLTQASGRGVLGGMLSDRAEPWVAWLAVAAAFAAFISGGISNPIPRLFIGSISCAAAVIAIVALYASAL